MAPAQSFRRYVQIALRCNLCILSFSTFSSADHFHYSNNDDDMIHPVDSSASTLSTSVNSEDAASTPSTASSSSTSSTSSHTPLIPKEIEVYPMPAPYLQLSYNKHKNCLVSILVGPSQYVAMLDEQDYPEMQRLSYSESSTSDSSSTTSNKKINRNEEENDSHGTLLAAYMAAKMPPPPEIVWLDGSWLQGGSDEGDDLTDRQALLQDSVSQDGSASGNSCGGLLRLVCSSASPKREGLSSRPSQRRSVSHRASLSPPLTGRNYGYASL